MPGNVAVSAPTTVMPWSLCLEFVHARAFEVEGNQYRNGESQRGLVTTTSRRQWMTKRRLDPATLATFETFFAARGGPLEPFYFYDPFETVPKFSYDATGEDEDGRYVVRFDNPWEAILGIRRGEVAVSLIELV